MRQLVDTTAQVEAVLVAGYRQMSAAAKARQVAELTKSVQRLALAGIRARHGSDLDEREQRLRLAALWLDRETMTRVFGWDPAAAGR